MKFLLLLFVIFLNGCVAIGGSFEKIEIKKNLGKGFLFDERNAEGQVFGL